MKLILKVIIYALAVFISAYLLQGGIRIDSWMGVLIVAVLLILLNATLKPILKLLALPITFLTLGCFSLIINAVIIVIIDALVDTFAVENFLWAIVFGVLVSICVSVFEVFDRD